MQASTSPLHVAHLLEHLRTGGAERMAADLLPALQQLRVRVTLYLYRDIGAIGHELERRGIKIEYIDKACLSTRLRGAWRLLHPLAVAVESTAFVWRLRRRLRADRVDVLHCHMFSAALWGGLAARLSGGRTRCVVTWHTLHSGKDSWKRRILGRYLIAGMDRLTAVSDAVAAGLCRQWGIPAERVISIPNGIPLDFPVPAGPVPLPGSAPRIAAIGRLEPVKGIDLLLNAVQRLLPAYPGLSCLLIGDGRARDSLHRQTADLGIAGHVYFLGERQDVRSLLPGIDLVVNCSHREGLPISLLEALAAQRPVIASDVGSNGDIVHNDRTGLLIPPGDAAALARAMTQVLDDPAGAARRAQHGRTLIETRYSLTATSAAWCELYREAVDSREKEDHAYR